MMPKSFIEKWPVYRTLFCDNEPLSWVLICCMMYAHSDNTIIEADLLTPSWLWPIHSSASWAFVYCFMHEEASLAPDSSMALRASLRMEHLAFIFRTGQVLQQIFPSMLTYNNDGRKLLQNWVQFIRDDCHVTHGPLSHGQCKASRSNRSKTQAWVSAPFKGQLQTVALKIHNFGRLLRA